MVVPVIVGPTGSGKTGVAVEIAKEVTDCGGARDGSRGVFSDDFESAVEIISADSRTVYKGMDIGTAKPDAEEMGGILHWGFGLVEPGERFTVKDWKDYAEQKIDEIEARNRTPMVVGGTGLYVDALVFDYKFNVPGKAYDENRGKCIKKLNNSDYPDRQKMCSKYKVFGILWQPEELRERLFLRADKMFRRELYEETEQLVKKFGWENKAMSSNIYKFAWKFMSGELTREEAVKLSALDDWHLAKRQITWFKRNENILWLPLEKMKETVVKCIQNEQRK